MTPEVESQLASILKDLEDRGHCRVALYEPELEEELVRRTHERFPGQVVVVMPDGTQEDVDVHLVRVLPSPRRKV